jgi:hypothetical protein
MARNSNVIFNCSEVIAACKGAKAAGQSLSTVFSIETTARPGPNGTKYMGLHCSVPGKKGRMMLRVVKEKHVGQIAPLDDAEVARINAERGGKYGGVKKRDRHPTLNVQKYNVRVETDDAGRPKGDLPGEENVSEYFQVCQFVDEFFYETMQARLADGSIILRDARRKDYPPGAIVVPSTKIVPFYQTHVSMESKTNPGAELANPISRTNMKFDKDTGMPKKVTFFDFTKSHRDAKTGKRSFEPLVFDGHPVTAHNVHLIASHSVFSGIVNMNAVCASNMGLSIPNEMEVVIVEPPATRGVGVDDVFEDGMFDDGDFPEDGEAKDEAPAEPAAAEPAAPAEPAAAPAPAPATAAVAEDDLADVLGDLGVEDA